MTVEENEWFDDAAGPLIRPYAVTRGRTRARDYGLDLITLIVAVPADPSAVSGQPEYAEIIRLCQRPLSVAEVGAHLDLPVTVVKVLLGDLIERNQIVFRAPSTLTEAPDTRILQAVLDGIRKL